MLTEIWDWSCDSTSGSARREQKHPSTIMVLHWHPLPGWTRHCVIVQLYQLGRNPLLNFYGLFKFGLDFYKKKKIKKASYSGCQFQLNNWRGSREPFLTDHVVLFGVAPTQNGDSALWGPALSTTERPTNRGGSTAGLTNTPESCCASRLARSSLSHGKSSSAYARGACRAVMSTHSSAGLMSAAW